MPQVPNNQGGLKFSNIKAQGIFVLIDMMPLAG